MFANFWLKVEKSPPTLYAAAVMLVDRFCCIGIGARVLFLSNTWGFLGLSLLDTLS